MGPTSPVPLPARGSAGKAQGKMTCCEASFDAPAGSDGRERLEHEGALAELPVGDGEAARSKLAAAPESEIEIEHAWTPAPTAAPAELALNLFETGEHLLGI